VAFYLGVFAQKVWRNKGVLAGLAALVAWYVKRKEVAAVVRERLNL
jgi:hypothetical protein